MEFTKWWVNEFKTIKFPAQGTVFDYYIDTETKEFLPWTERLPVFTLDLDIPLQVFCSHILPSNILCLFILLSLFSPLCRVFTIIYLKQIMFLGHLVLHLFCIYSLCYMYCYTASEVYFVLLH